MEESSVHTRVCTPGCAEPGGLDIDGGMEKDTWKGIDVSIPTRTIEVQYCTVKYIFSSKFWCEPAEKITFR